MGNYEIEIARDRLVVKSNDMIRKARYELTVHEQKLITYVVSLIKPEDHELQKYVISISDFCGITGIDRNKFYGEIKTLMRNIDDKRYWIENSEMMGFVRWFSEFHYLPKEGKVELLLDSYLRKYLIGLSENFTQYEIYNILALKGKYSIRLYEWFKSYSFMHEKEIELDELKRLLMAENYVEFKAFRRRVIEPAISEINEYTDLSVGYEKITRGRSIARIKFIISTKGTVDRLIANAKTRGVIDEAKGQIPGQMDMFDLMEGQKGT